MGPSNIEYSTRDDCPGTFFRCAPMSASLSVTSCAKMWKEANSRKIDPCDRLHHCQQCQAGAKHAGVQYVAASALYGAKMCSRCHRPSPRLINGRLCPSCVNREYEVIKGRNGKGTKPIKAAKLQPLELRYVLGDTVKTFSLSHALDSTELMVAVLMKNKNPVFAFHAKPISMPVQLYLF